MTIGSAYPFYMNTSYPANLYGASNNPDAAGKAFNSVSDNPDEAKKMFGSAANPDGAKTVFSDAADDVNGVQSIFKKPETGEAEDGKKVSPEECETCKRRKYQDGSDENVSFKSAAHISPESAAATVRSHEQEHVSNAYAKAEEKDGEVISASVSIHTAICPECGRVYVSGGTTETMIRYPNEDNPYQQERKAQDEIALKGANIDYAA